MPSYYAAPPPIGTQSNLTSVQGLAVGSSISADTVKRISAFVNRGTRTVLPSPTRTIISTGARQIPTRQASTAPSVTVVDGGLPSVDYGYVGGEVEEEKPFYKKAPFIVGASVVGLGILLLAVR